MTRPILSPSSPHCLLSIINRPTRVAVVSITEAEIEKYLAAPLATWPRDHKTADDTIDTHDRRRRTRQFPVGSPRDRMGQPLYYVVWSESAQRTTQSDRLARSVPRAKRRPNSLQIGPLCIHPQAKWQLCAALVLRYGVVLIDDIRKTFLDDKRLTDCKRAEEGPRGSQIVTGAVFRWIDKSAAGMSLFNEIHTIHLMDSRNAGSIVNCSIYIDKSTDSIQGEVFRRQQTKQTVRSYI